MQTQSIETDVRSTSVDRTPSAPLPAESAGRTDTNCYHCGASCRNVSVRQHGKNFCCRGCLSVFELLSEHGLGDFYSLNNTAGVRVNSVASHDQFNYLDEPSIQEKLVDYRDGSLTRVTFRLPTIHCIACVWLIENLFRFKPGIGQSQVNFPRKEAAISFEPGRVKLSEVAALLTSLGYEPELKFSDLQKKPKTNLSRRLWMQLGVAGFVFGNTMFFSIAGYLGLDAFSGPAFRKLVGYISLLLSIPVLLYSAADFWRSAWLNLRQHLLSIDVPIVAGIAALFGQSCYEVLSGRGDGYFDSFAGLLFFLLCGKLFQQKTFDRLAFDRDYKSFFPLAVTRISGSLEESVALSGIAVGDLLIIRGGELIPSDARLIEGPALIDYSFVTGESEPVSKNRADHLYAGGKQIGSAITVETVKPVSQSYLTSLWNQEAFRKNPTETLNAITNRYSYRFTKLVMAIAVGAAVVWLFIDPAVSLKAFISVLIVACPCALALAAPFALGSAQRVLARRNIFLKNPYIIETLAKVDSVVFDKTGTLTAAGAGSVAWRGDTLNENESRWIYAMTRQAIHPLAARLREVFPQIQSSEIVRSFRETPGAGMEGNVGGHEICMGSQNWLEVRNIPRVAESEASRAVRAGSVINKGSLVHIAIDGRYRGHFVLESSIRPAVDRLLKQLSGGPSLTLLSGDNELDRDRFQTLFGPQTLIRFNQSPLEKLSFIHGLQKQGKIVMMVGDGLNDAGALKQSDVGVAVVENISAFSPASDVIMAASMVPSLAAVLKFSKQSMSVVRGAFFISARYNVLGIGIAASGRLSPIICAILMPLSSVTVVVFSCGAITWLGRRLGFEAKKDQYKAKEVKR
jgi:Cu+-exporting ATPase